MDTPVFTHYWALWAAAGCAAIVVYAVVARLIDQSGSGQLRQALKEHRAAINELRKARRQVRRAERRVATLGKKAERTKPRVLTEAKESLQDARSLLKICDDRSQVTANHVRRVIFEEFPPVRHETLRRRYLPEDVADNRPFSFDS